MEARTYLRAALERFETLGAALWAEPGPAGSGTTFVVQFPALVGAVSETIRPEAIR